MRVIALAAAALITISGSARVLGAEPGRPRLAVIFLGSAARLPAPDIRQAIDAELDAELVDDLSRAEGVLAIAVEPSGRLALTYRAFTAGTIGTHRSIPPPAAAADTPTLLALLAANLIRNEALELLPLAPGAPPAPPAAAPPASSPGKRAALDARVWPGEPYTGPAARPWPGEPYTGRPGGR